MHRTEEIADADGRYLWRWSYVVCDTCGASERVDDYWLATGTYPHGWRKYLKDKVLLCAMCPNCVESHNIEDQKYEKPEHQMTAVHWNQLIQRGVDLRERHPFDFYPTNQAHVAAAFDLLPNSFIPEKVLDPGMGMGVFGKEAKKRWQDSFVVGVELNNDMPLHRWYDWNIRGDFLSVPFDEAFDLVIGNPPYGEAEAFVRRSLALLRPDGWLIFLLRLSFAESVTRFLMFTHEAPPFSVVTCSDRPSFTGDGKTDSSAYAYFVWQKGYQGKTILDWVVADPKKAEKQVYQPSLFELEAM